jgi:hypothetical protein
LSTYHAYVTEIVRPEAGVELIETLCHVSGDVVRYE